jgi:hypothetical protein
MEEEEKEEKNRNNGINEKESFSTQSSEFNPRPFHVGFMVEIVYCVSHHSATFHLINLFPATS